MSWLRFFRRRQKEVEKQLAELGLYILNDKRLDGRIELFSLFHQKIKECHKLSGPPEKQLEIISETINELNDMLHNTAVPFGRAGDTRWYAMAMHGWSTIHSRMLDLLSSTRELMGKIGRGESVPVTSKEECLRKLKHFFETFYLKYLFLIIEISWLREDVSPSWNITVQQVAPAPYAVPPVPKYDTGSPSETLQQPDKRLPRRPKPEEFGG